MTQFISDSSQIERNEAIVKYYGKGGSECKQEQAILVSSDINGKVTYKALIYNGSLYDPTSIKFPRDRQYHIVSKACFDKYALALSTGDYGNYEKAVREYRKPK